MRGALGVVDDEDADGGGGTDDVRGGVLLGAALRVGVDEFDVRAGAGALEWCVLVAVVAAAARADDEALGARVEPAGCGAPGTALPAGVSEASCFFTAAIRLRRSAALAPPEASRLCNRANSAVALATVAVAEPCGRAEAG